MRWLWEISIRSNWERHLRDLSQISRDDLFVTSLCRLKYISKKKSFLWRLYDVSHISWKRCLSSETSQKHLSEVFVIFQKHPTKMVLRDFRRVIKISDKTYVTLLETLKKWNVFWEQYRDIHQVCHEYQWADICVRVLVSQWLWKRNSRCIIYYF